MKTLFVAINTKYIHTNLAVRYMQLLAEQNGYLITAIAEYTINHRIPQLLRELYLTKADHMILSCYIQFCIYDIYLHKKPKKFLSFINNVYQQRDITGKALHTILPI